MKKSYFYLVFLMPLFLIALMKLCPAPTAPIPAEQKLSAAEQRALEAEERRAERREAREARRAEKAAAKAATVQQFAAPAPDFGNMSFGEFPPAPGAGFDNTMAMAPGMGFGGGFGGPGMGFGGGFGGF